MEFLLIFFGLLATMVTGAGVWLVRSSKNTLDCNEDAPIHSAGHYKRVQREKDFKEWDNEYISILQGAFLEKYKIPYNEAQLAYVAYNNYVSSKKAIDVVGDRAYWFDDCPMTKSTYSNNYEENMVLAKKESKKVRENNVVPTSEFSGLVGPVGSSFDMYNLEETLVRPVWNTITANKISSGMITASRLYSGGSSCSCESCDFNAKMDTYNRMKSIWDHTKEQISMEYPEFVFENLPKELPELSA